MRILAMGQKNQKSSSLGNQLIANLAQGLAKPSTPVATIMPAQPRIDPRYAILKNQDVPDARWDVSGAFVYQNLLIRVHDFFAALGIRTLSCVHDAPLCMWNSGRVKMGLHAEQHAITQALQAYNHRRIPVHLTLTNSLLTPECLADPVGNILLRMLDDLNDGGENGVIVCSELLADHVRKNFPALKLISSVVKVAHEDGKGKLDYYRRLEEKYDKIMVHPDDNFNIELLQKLENKNRYEILVNEPCIKDCQVRKLHYQVLSQLSLNMLNSALVYKENEVRSRNDCGNAADLLFSQDQRTLILSRNELKQIYDLGFRNFKIQGRGMTSDHAMAHEIFRLMLNQDPSCDHLVTRMLQRFHCGV
jgi:hypothetical protein